MKAKLIIVVLAALLPGWADGQTNFDELVTGQGTFTNAHITTVTPAYVIVLHDSGGARVSMTNLPYSLQKRFGYDPDKAAAALIAEQSKKDAIRKAGEDQARYLASLRGTNQIVHVSAILDAFGQCQTSVGRIYLNGLSPSVKNYLANYYQLKADIADYSDRVERMRKAASRADANAAVGASGSPEYVNAVMAQRTRANNMVEDANQATTQLGKMRSNLEQWEIGLIPATTVLACPIGTQHGGLAVWDFVSIAPPLVSQ